MNRSVKFFIQMVKQDCKNNHVTVKLNNTTYVKYGIMKVNGFFESYSDKNPILAVAMKKEEPKWIKTLVHEYNHMQQWKEQCPAWTGLQLRKGVYANNVIDDWLNGTNFSNATLDLAFDAALQMELDCEKRVIQTIKDFNLNIDITEYIQRTNAYVLFYKMIRKYKKWYIINKEPYNIESIWTKMPKTFKNIYDKPLCATHEKLLLKCFE